MKCGMCGDVLNANKECDTCITKALAKEIEQRECPHEFDASEGYTCLHCGKDGAEDVLSVLYDRGKDLRKYGE